MRNIALVICGAAGLIHGIGGSIGGTLWGYLAAFLGYALLAIGIINDARRGDQ